MTIANHRRAADYSAARLRRARRLYFYLIANHIPQGVDGIRMVAALAPRLQARGFYSITTDLRGIKFNFYRQKYRKQKKYPVQVNRDKDWYRWLLANGYGGAPWYDRELPEKRRIRA